MICEFFTKNSVFKFLLPSKKPGLYLRVSLYCHVESFQSSCTQRSNFGPEQVRIYTDILFLIFFLFFFGGGVLTDIFKAFFAMFVAAGSQNRQTYPDEQTVGSVVQAGIIQALLNLNTKNRR